MPIRFSTQAANADHLNDDSLPQDPIADGAKPGRASGTPKREPRSGARDAADGGMAGKPGKDINAPGFIKESDPDKS